MQMCDKENQILLLDNDDFLFLLDALQEPVHLLNVDIPALTPQRYHLNNAVG